MTLLYYMQELFFFLKGSVSAYHTYALISFNNAFLCSFALFMQKTDLIVCLLLLLKLFSLFQ